MYACVRHCIVNVYALCARLYVVRFCIGTVSFLYEHLKFFCVRVIRFFVFLCMRNVLICMHLCMSSLCTFKLYLFKCVFVNLVYKKVFLYNFFKCFSSLSLFFVVRFYTTSYVTRRRRLSIDRCSCCCDGSFRS